MSKIIVISGGSDGIGKETAKLLSPDNKVIILSPHLEKLQAAAKEANCEYEMCDVTMSSSINQAIANIINKYGRVDCLINGAGIWIEGQLEANKPEDIENVLKVNTLGTILLTQKVIPYMKKQTVGQIINIVSVAGLLAQEERSVYNASKWAIRGFTDCLVKDLSKFNVRVTGVYPARVNTKLFEKAGFPKEMDDAINSFEVAKTIEFIVNSDSKTLYSHIEIKNVDQPL